MSKFFPSFFFSSSLALKLGEKSSTSRKNSEKATDLFRRNF